MDSLTRTAGPLAALAVVATLGAAPAHGAVTHDYRDVRGEARTYVDLHAVRLASTGRSVVIRTKHDDLRRGLRAGGSLSIFLDVDRSRTGPEYAFVGGLSRGTDYALVVADDWTMGDRVHDAELDLELDQQRDTARVRIARSSLGDPQELRIAVRVDGPRPNGSQETDWLRTVEHLTPWVGLDDAG